MKELLISMFEVGCIQFSPKEPFTYASGLKGPIYCDNRLIPSHPKLRTLVAQGLSDIIDRENLNYDVVTGVATAGITHATLLAHLREEPMAYVRAKPKGHGKGKIVEGDVDDNQELLLIEDLVNQGSSISKVIDAVRERGHKVNYALCIVDYEMASARNLLNELNVELFSLIKFSELTDIALHEKIIDQEDYDLLHNWHNDPRAWS